MHDIELIKTFKQRYESKKFELTKMDDGSAVLLSIESGKVITLNTVATNIVYFIVNQSTIDDTTRDKLLDHLLEQFEVQAVKLKEDIDNFISALNENI